MTHARNVLDIARTFFFPREGTIWRRILFVLCITIPMTLATAAHLAMRTSAAPMQAAQSPMNYQQLKDQTGTNAAELQDHESRLQQHDQKFQDIDAQLADIRATLKLILYRLDHPDHRDSDGVSWHEFGNSIVIGLLGLWKIHEEVTRRMKGD